MVLHFVILETEKTSFVKSNKAEHYYVHIESLTNMSGLKVPCGIS